MVDKKADYVIDLNHKWMSLDLMSRVYSTIPMIPESECDVDGLDVNQNDILNKPPQDKGFFSKAVGYVFGKKEAKKEEVKVEDLTVSLINELDQICVDKQKFVKDKEII